MQFSFADLLLQGLDALTGIYLNETDSSRYFKALWRVSEHAAKIESGRACITTEVKKFQCSRLTLVPSFSVTNAPVSFNTACKQLLHVFLVNTFDS